MAAWVCLNPECETTYSVDAPHCPQCGETAHREDWEEPAKPTTGTAAKPPQANTSTSASAAPVAAKTE